jgi:death on curing protein
MSTWGNCLPAKAVHYLTRDEVLAIHQGLIDRFGGLEVVRDLGLLESALYRPRTGYYGDLAEMAAALFESLLMNHAFIDGNKRVAFFATDIFLRLNGWKLKVEPNAAHKLLIGLLERKECDFEHLLPWIRKSLVRSPSRRPPYEP